MCAGYQGTLPRMPELYRKIVCPTLVLWGENDKHFPVEHARRLQECIAGAQLQIVTQGEHWMAWDRADELAVKIRAFLGSVVA
jgi:pimeloyl-ACP methyl ester carboxylesterase